MAIRFYPLGGGGIGYRAPIYTPQPQPITPITQPAPTPTPTATATAEAVEHIVDLIPYLPDLWEKKLEAIRARNPVLYAQLVGELRKLAEITPPADTIKSFVQAGQLVRTALANAGLAVVGRPPTLSVASKDGSRVLLLYSLESGMIAIEIFINMGAVPPGIADIFVHTDLTAISMAIKAILSTYITAPPIA